VCCDFNKWRYLVRCVGRGDSLYANPRLSQSMEGVSPRRRTFSGGTSLDDPPDLLADQIQLKYAILHFLFYTLFIIY
jgi:hypothetical protein